MRCVRRRYSDRTAACLSLARFFWVRGGPGRPVSRLGSFVPPDNVPRGARLVGVNSESAITTKTSNHQNDNAGLQPRHMQGCNRDIYPGKCTVTLSLEGNNKDTRYASLAIDRADR